VRRSGLTLLETMVALVILGLVVVGFLAVFQGSMRLARDSERWAEAVAYAEDAMEAVKLDPAELLAPAPVELRGGFERSVETRAWGGDDSVRVVTVVVTLPDGGGHMTLTRLVATR